MERLSLLADTDTLLAARTLNRASWQLQGFATSVMGSVDASEWEAAVRVYNNAINDFHEAARREMQVPGVYPRRTSEPSPHPAVFQNLDEETRNLHLKNVRPPESQ